jgi:hypothetical protein
MSETTLRFARSVKQFTDATHINVEVDKFIGILEDRENLKTRVDETRSKTDTKMDAKEFLGKVLTGIENRAREQYDITSISAHPSTTAPSHLSMVRCAAYRELAHMYESLYKQYRLLWELDDDA